MAKSLEQIWQIGNWEIDTKLHRLKNGEQEWPIKPRLSRLLAFFLLHQNEIITREELLDKVWEGRLVSEDSLAKSVSELRKFLQEHFSDLIQIETLRQVGYRLNMQKKAYSRISPGQSLVSQAKKAGNINIGLLFSMGFIFLIAIAIVFTILGMNQEKNEAPFANYTSKVLTWSKGMEIYPAVSPDATYLAYSWRETPGTPWHIYIKPIDGASARRLTKGTEAYEFFPAWSPDGHSIAFLRRLENSTWQIVKIPAMGGDEELLTTLSLEDMYGQLLWSPNGRYLVFSAAEKTGIPYQLYLFDFDNYQVNPISDPPENTFGDCFPTFLAQGRKLSFVRSQIGPNMLSFKGPSSSEILELDLGSPDFKKVFSSEHSISGLVWDQQAGHYLCWFVHQFGQYSLWSISENGQLGHEFIGAAEGTPANSKGLGKKPGICYEVWNSTMNINRYPIRSNLNDSLNPEEYIYSTFWDWGIRLASETSKAAFISSRSGQQEIWLADSQNTDNVFQVTDIKSPLLKWISITPDGSRVLFSSNHEGSFHIYLVDTNGKNLQQLTQGTAQFAAPEWSADGNSFYYSTDKTGTWQIWKRNIDNSQNIQLTTKGGYRAIPDLKQKDAFYFTHFETDGIWHFTGEQSPKQLLSSENAPADPLNWEVGQSGIYFIKWEKGTCLLHFFDFEDQEVRKILTLENLIPGTPALAISSDEQFVYISQSSNAVNSDIWMWAPE